MNDFKLRIIPTQKKTNQELLADALLYVGLLRVVADKPRIHGPRPWIEVQTSAKNHVVEHLTELQRRIGKPPEPEQLEEEEEEEEEKEPA
jgi:hypothetical protein